MPNDYGEIRYDRDDLLSDAALLAATLEQYGTVAFVYVAHSTAHRMIAFDAKLLAPPWARLHGRGPNGIAVEEDSHTLWLREVRNNRSSGPWLGRGQVHVPTYLGEKYETNAVDSHGLAVLLELVEMFRRAESLGEHRTLRAQSLERIHIWTQALLQVTGGAIERELPAFMQDVQPDQGGPP